MHIFLKIVGESREPMKAEFHGNYAIELMLFQITERYFGREIRVKFEGILKGSEVLI